MFELFDFNLAVTVFVSLIIGYMIGRALTILEIPEIRKKYVDRIKKDFKVVWEMSKPPKKEEDDEW